MLVMPRSNVPSIGALQLGQLVGTSVRASSNDTASAAASSVLARSISPDLTRPIIAFQLSASSLSR